jgi:hypothetical protein
VSADSVACRVAVSPHGTPAARSSHALAAHGSPHNAVVQGLEVSRGDILQHQLLQAQLRYLPLQLRVLLLQILQPSSLFHLQPAVLLAPTVIGLLDDLSLLAGLQYPMAEAFEQEITALYEAREQEHEGRRLESSLSPRRGPRLSNLPLGRFRSSTRYQARPAAADIAFCVAAFANGMTEDRIGCALEDDYLSRDPSLSKRTAYIRRTMEKAKDGPSDEHRCRDSPL